MFSPSPEAPGQRSSQSWPKFSRYSKSSELMPGSSDVSSSTWQREQSPGFFFNRSPGERSPGLLSTLAERSVGPEPGFFCFFRFLFLLHPGLTLPTVQLLCSLPHASPAQGPAAPAPSADTAPPSNPPRGSPGPAWNHISLKNLGALGGLWAGVALKLPFVANILGALGGLWDGGAPNGASSSLGTFALGKNAGQRG